MRTDYLGDSYDLVKHCLLRWLGRLGLWAVDPMFTGSLTRADARAFAALLGAPLLTESVLSSSGDRAAYFASARSCQSHLFLDPNIGVRPKALRGKAASDYLFLEELAEIAAGRPRFLTLVYDQCLRRGGEQEALLAKLATLSSRGIPGIAYRSHAAFILLSPDKALVKRARTALVSDGHLPARRILSPVAA